MLLLMQAEYAENIVVFMNRFAEISTLLFIPPVAIRVPMLPILSGRIDIAAILGWSA
jgi:hypothetical protein